MLNLLEDPADGRTLPNDGGEPQPLALFTPLHRAILASFTMSPVISRAVVVSIASAVGLAAVWKVVRVTTGARWYLLAGLALGFIIAGGIR